ncbi:FAD:protein FMN transferase [Staphylococcus debuckii]|uniref:FAD:protein FMN transferase n=1 Tax=Staphylococcus debuckii TaxID=2044912 RepID=A0ABU9EUW4_9STAP
MKTETLHLMGTVITMQIEHLNAEVLLHKASEMLRDYEKRFSANDDYSDLMQVNLNAGIQPVRVDADLFTLIEKAQEVSLSSGQKFNLTIGPLVKLWKIGFKDAALPEDEAIQQTLKVIQPDNVVLDREQQTVYLTEAGMEIDLGAIAKGYFADQLKDYFVEQGVESGIIDLGGNVVTIGHPLEKKAWTVGVQSPEKSRGNILGFIEIHNQSVVTSGIYERHFYKDDKLYHHILDSKTGYPVENDIASVTIVSDQSLDGEIWSTICFFTTAEQTIALLNEINGIDALVIKKNGEIMSTQHLKKHLYLI